MNVCKETMLVLKSKYRGLLRKVMTVDDKFELTLAKYDDELERLVNAVGEVSAAKTRYVDAMTKMGKSCDDKVDLFETKVKELENRSIELYKKRKQIEARRSEYVARIEAAVAMKEATKCLKGIGNVGVAPTDLGDLLRDCDAEIARLESETELILKMC